MAFSSNDIYIIQRNNGNTAFVEKNLLAATNSVVTFDSASNLVSIPISAFSSSASGSGTTLTTGSTYPITSSWAISSSYALSSSHADSASTAISASYAPNAESGTTLTTGSTYPITSSWSDNANTASYVTSSNVVGNVISSSYSLSSSNAISASWAPSSGGTTLVTGSTYPITSSWSDNANTASYVTSSNVVGPVINSLNAVSSSMAQSASFVSSSNVFGTVASSSYAATASIYLGSVTSASYSVSSSKAQSANTASFITASAIAGTVNSSSYAVTASRSNNADSASYLAENQQYLKVGTVEANIIGGNTIESHTGIVSFGDPTQISATSTVFTFHNEEVSQDSYIGEMGQGPGFYGDLHGNADTATRAIDADSADSLGNTSNLNVTYQTPNWFFKAPISASAITASLNGSRVITSQLTASSMVATGSLFGTASFAQTASFYGGSVSTASLGLTGSHAYNSGSMVVTSDTAVLITTKTLSGRDGLPVVIVPGTSNTLGANITMSAGICTSGNGGNVAVWGGAGIGGTGGDVIIKGGAGSTTAGRFIVQDSAGANRITLNGSVMSVTGSLAVTGSITSSLLGNVYTPAVSASWAVTQSANFNTSASHITTAVNSATYFGTANRSAGQSITFTFGLSGSATDQNVFFESGWKWLTTQPTKLTGGKSAWFVVTAAGSATSDVWAAWKETP